MHIYIYICICPFDYLVFTFRMKNLKLVWVRPIRRMDEVAPSQKGVIVPSTLVIARSKMIPLKIVTLR